MSELDHSFQELRDDLRSTITPPDLGQVVDRARQRSTRRRMQIGAIAAVVVVSASVPALRLMPENPAPAGPPAPPVTHQVDFADADHGYALESVCAGSCTFTLLATTDGGRGWAPLPMPGGDEAYRKSELLVVGPEQLVIHLSPVDQEAAPAGFFSTDSGRTWRDFDALALTEPTVIPPGAKVQTLCTETSVPGECKSHVNVLDPAKGVVWTVPTQPPLVAMSPGQVATAGGEFWVTGRDASGKPAIAVTTDGGRTWATNPLDVQGEPTRRNPWSVVEQDGTLYLTMVGSVGNTPVELLAVFRSTDRGQSWTRTWQPADGHRLLNVFGDAVATADGRLLVYSTTEGTLESRDGGRTFTKADRQLAGPVTWTRGGYLAKGADGYEISRDGLDWRRFELP